MARALSSPAEVWAGTRILAEPQFVPAREAASFIVVDPAGARLMLSPLGRGAALQLQLCPPILCVPQTGRGVYGWLPDGSALVYAGTDRRLHWHDLASGACRPLSIPPADVSGLAIAPCGTRAAFAVDTCFIGMASLEDEGQVSRVSRTGEFAMDPVWSPDGGTLAWHEWDAPNMPWQASRIVMRACDGEAPAVIFTAGDHAVAQPRFSPDGSRLGFLSDRDGWLNLWEAQVEGKREWRQLTTGRCELAPPSWGPGLRTWAWTGNSQVAVWRNRQACGSLELWRDGEFSMEVRRRVVPNGLTASSDGAILAVHGAAGGFPRVEMIANGGVSVIALSAPPTLDVPRPDPETVGWHSEGQRIEARLHRAAATADRPPPMLIWLHQGPTGQMLATMEPRIGYFVERGWSVLVPDYRGSTGHGREFMLSLFGKWGRADLADIVAGTTVAIREGWCDPSRIALFGGSAGGFLTLRLLAERPELFAAGIALFPVCDLVDTSTPPWRYQTHYVEQLLGGRAAERADLAEISPSEHPERIGRPILMLHGSEDIIVPARHSKMLAAAINAAGGRAEYKLYPGEGHGWPHGPTLADELRRVEGFLNRHVPASPDGFRDLPWNASSDAATGATHNARR